MWYIYASFIKSILRQTVKKSLLCKLVDSQGSFQVNDSMILKKRVMLRVHRGTPKLHVETIFLRIYLCSPSPIVPKILYCKSKYLLSYSTVCTGNQCLMNHVNLKALLFHQRDYFFQLSWARGALHSFQFRFCCCCVILHVEMAFSFQCKHF